jgi:DNA ligase-associated metallophosphoesterase
MEIKIHNNHFKLLPHKALFWKEENTLLIGDLHLGKVTHFRKEGIAIPSSAFEDNFKRLNEILLSNTIHRIIFLGDLFHNRLNAEWDLFAEWRSKHHSVEMIIVLGNHDVLPQRCFDEVQIKVYDEEYIEGQFLFAHHPKESFNKHQFVFCGHIHPIYYLKSKGRSRIKLSCFVHDNYQIILPSFGVFTGGYEMKAEHGREIYLIVEDNVIAAPRVSKK